MASLLKSTGASVPITEELTLEAMRRLVGDGDDVEFVMLRRAEQGHELLIVDEDGLFSGKPINQAATALYRHARDPQGVIVGDAIHCVCVDMGLESEAYR